MKITVDDLLKEKGHTVYSIEDTKQLKDAVKIFNQKHVGALIVLNKEEEIQGIITERDIMMRLGQTEGEIRGINIRKVMTPREKLIIGTPEDDIEYIMKVITTNRIRHIPIVGGEGHCKLEGLISIGDVVKALLNDVGYENKFLKDYIEGV